MVYHAQAFHFYRAAGTTVARFDKAAVSKRDRPFVRQVKINPFSF